MKKLLILFLSFIMILSFAGCGGSGSGSDTGAEATETAAEANAGVKDIVFVMPDEWEMFGFSDDQSVLFSKADSDFIFSAAAYDEEMISQFGLENASTVEDFYNNYFIPNDESIEKYNLDVKDVTACGEKATCTVRKNKDNKPCSISTFWLKDDIIHEFNMGSQYMYDENGELKDDVPLLSDDDIAMFEGVIASAAYGDGSAMLENTNINSIGSFTFEVPENYTLESIGSNTAIFEKKDSDISISISRTTQKDYDGWMFDGEKPETLKDYYKSMIHDGLEKVQIAGYDGYVNKFEDEDEGSWYYNAFFFANDELYEVYLSDKSYDNEGNKIEGAETISEEDISSAEALVKSLAAK